MALFHAIESAIIIIKILVYFHFNFIIYRIFHILLRLFYLKTFFLYFLINIEIGIIHDFILFHVKFFEREIKGFMILYLFLSKLENF